MSRKWSTPKRCYCKDSDTGKDLGRTCPKLTQRHHGTFGYGTRIPTSKGQRELRRFGFATKTKADEAANHAWDLIGLGHSDKKTRARIGDLIFEKTARGGELPSVEDVRRRLGLGQDLDSSETFGDAWRAWLAGRRKIRRGYARNLEQLGRHWLLPVLADIALERVNGEHCAAVFERVEMFNEEIEAAREGKRKPVLTGDVRVRPKHCGIATQHRIFAALRVFLNHQWKRAHKITFNPVYAVELESETRAASLVWTPAQVADFLDYTADHRLSFLWRLALLRGFRRGELCGVADDDMDLDAASITVNVALLQVGGQLVWDKPKSRAGERVVGLDEGSVQEGHAHRARLKRERLAAGSDWQDSGRLFTREDGSPLHPEHVSRTFKQLSRDASLPVMKFHGTRHTAATLALQAKVEPKIVSETLGHSTTRVTADLYQHVSVQMQIGAAETVVALLPKRTKAKRAGSPDLAHDCGAHGELSLPSGNCLGDSTRVGRLSWSRP
jgi:integrase